jgi:hypothetical protein
MELLLVALLVVVAGPGLLLLPRCPGLYTCAMVLVVLKADTRSNKPRGVCLQVEGTQKHMRQLLTQVYNCWCLGQAA